MMRAVPRKQILPSSRPTGAGHSLFSGDKERYVRDMFAAIAPRYDLLNSILSLNQHRRWRRLAVRLSEARPGDACLDVCTGTGDFALDLSRAVGSAGRVLGADFCEPMLRAGRGKVGGSRTPIRLMAANAEALPYHANTFDAVTVGFGVRNVAHLERAIAEMARVVKPGRRLVILEFNRPRPGPLRAIVDLYLFHVLPRIGGLLSRREAYTYLPESMKVFVSREELSNIMQRCGLRDVVVRDMNFGTVCIHVGVKRDQGPAV